MKRTKKTVERRKMIGATPLVATQTPMHPEILKLVKIAALQDDTKPTWKWIHNHFCDYFDRHDLRVEEAAAAS